MRGLTRDISLAARRLLGTPLFTTFAVLSLAVGVGVTTAMYSVVEAIFLREPGVRDPERLVFVVGYRPVLEGLALGLFIGLAGRAIVRGYLDIEVNVVDPWMAVVPIPLVLAAFCACYLPARRASAVDPNVALRHL